MSLRRARPTWASRGRAATVAFVIGMFATIAAGCSTPGSDGSDDDPGMLHVHALQGDRSKDEASWESCSAATPDVGDSAAHETEARLQPVVE